MELVHRLQQLHGEQVDVLEMKKRWGRSVPGSTMVVIAAVVAVHLHVLPTLNTKPKHLCLICRRL
jgi:hypothetical protein